MNFQGKTYVKMEVCKIKKKRIFWIFVIILVVSLTAYLIRPYIQVERLTKKYGSEFEDRYVENGFYDEIEYMKVFKYREESAGISYIGINGLKDRLMNLGDDYAVVLYVEKNHSSASLYVFRDEDSRWDFLEWNLVWSYSGSADSFMWPYYP